MTNRIKVVPNTPEAVGMRHPQDGALSAEGSLWAYDTFTLQRLFAGSIRHAEEGTSAPAEEAAGDDAPPPAGKPGRGLKGAAAPSTSAA